MRNMPKPKHKDSAAEQCARFREAVKKTGGDQQSFEKAFKKIVPSAEKKKPKNT
jgi:hypothetical protein